MPANSELYEKVSELIAENKINSAIELLQEELPRLKDSGADHYHAALLLMQDFNDIQQRKINGLLVAEAEDRAFSLRLLEFARGLKIGRNVPPPPPPSPDPLRVAQPAYASTPQRGPSGKSGPSVGQVLLYVLAALGGLVVIGLLVQGEEDDPGTQALSAYEAPASVTTTPPASTTEVEPEPRPQRETTPAPAQRETTPPPAQRVQERTPAPRQKTALEQLGGTVWYHSELSLVRFSADGTIGDYLNGLGGFAYVGQEPGGAIYGNWVNTATGLTGTFRIEPPFTDDEIVMQSRDVFGNEFAYLLTRQ
ncbi:hypothetical protein [Lewinella sp. W8]|uniref:hypothetical protein n=1 Tax=Lewinella sp. W8 TaxID=2528208 RepID=UPI001067D2E0|nr:hypothetical protein [Lewinella sp. W8]MTB52729.1 hypothetical protein [Lewinella sp. W8]